jgi:hypothetical protein
LIIGSRVAAGLDLLPVENPASGNQVKGKHHGPTSASERTMAAFPMENFGSARAEDVL